jgi:hypothetical protein
MAVTIDETSANILAALLLESCRGYAARHPEAHAAYLAQTAAQVAQAKRKRQSKRQQFGSK